MVDRMSSMAGSAKLSRLTLLRPARLLHLRLSRLRLVEMKSQRISETDQAEMVKKVEPIMQKYAPFFPQ